MKFIQFLFVCFASFILYDGLQAHNHRHEFIGAECIRHGKDIIRILPAIIASEWLLFSKTVKQEFIESDQQSNLFSISLRRRSCIYAVQLGLNVLPALYYGSSVDMLCKQLTHLIDQEISQFSSEKESISQNIFSIKNLALSATLSARICLGVCHADWRTQYRNHTDQKKKFFDWQKMQISITGCLVKELALYLLQDKIARAIATDYKTMKELEHIELEELKKAQSFKTLNKEIFEEYGIPTSISGECLPRRSSRKRMIPAGSSDSPSFNSSENMANPSIYAQRSESATPVDNDNPSFETGVGLEN